MIGIVLISHGDFAKAAIQSAALLAGKQEKLVAFGLAHGDSPETLREEVQAAIEVLDEGQGVLVLVDFYGGTPANEVMKLVGNHQIHVISGLNLGMLLEAILKRGELALEALAAAALTSGLANIMDMNARYQEITKERSGNK